MLFFAFIDIRVWCCCWLPLVFSISLEVCSSIWTEPSLLFRNILQLGCLFVLLGWELTIDVQIFCSLRNYVAFMPSILWCIRTSLIFILSWCRPCLFIIILRCRVLFFSFADWHVYIAERKGRIPRRSCRRETFVTSWKSVNKGISHQRISLIVVKVM